MRAAPRGSIGAAAAGGHQVLGVRFASPSRCPERSRTIKAPFWWRPSLTLDRAAPVPGVVVMRDVFCGAWFAGRDATHRRDRAQMLVLAGNVIEHPPSI